VNDKVSFVCTTYRRFSCVERIIYQYYAQTHENKELIIFNTDTEHPFTLDFDDINIIVINNNTDYQTGKEYTTRGQICRDAVTHARGDYFMLADDDDIYLPWHMHQAVDGIKQNGLDSWKPEKSFFAQPHKIVLVMNTLEASVIVKMPRIRQIGFRTDKTGYEGLSWYTRLHDEGQLNADNPNYVPSYCFNWSDPDEIAGHKQSGNIDSPTNFEEHKKASRDYARRPLTRIQHSSCYDRYYTWFKENKDLVNKEYYHRYARHFVEYYYSGLGIWT
jgi:hypothetical protein